MTNDPEETQQTRPPLGRRVHAFSLIEVLTVLALLGVLSGVVIGWYAGYHREKIERLTNQRNAQEIVSIGVCATVGGSEFVVPEDKESTVENLVAGVVGQTGIWKGKVFRLSNLQPAALAGALEFVSFESGLLLYEPAGGQP